MTVLRCLIFLVLAATMQGCGGSKVLKEAKPIDAERALATAADPRLSAALDWVIVRDGPGTWAKNADWDEYLLQVTNLADVPVTLRKITVVDSLGARLDSSDTRKQLVRGTKQTARRYKQQSIEVKAGRGTATMLLAGAAVTVVGAATASAAASAAIMAGSTSAGSAGIAAGGLLLAGPALAVGGVMRAVNHGRVNSHIEQRQTPLPLELATDQERVVRAFFPIAPSPGAVEISYTSGKADYVLALDVSEPLDGLHIAVSED